VKDVRVTTRLISSPACLVVDEYGIDPSLKRLLEASGQKYHLTSPFWRSIRSTPSHVNEDEQDEQRFADWANILFDQSVLSSGETLSDPIAFVNRLNALLTQLS